MDPRLFGAGHVDDPAGFGPLLRRPHQAKEYLSTLCIALSVSAGQHGLGGVRVQPVLWPGCGRRDRQSRLVHVERGGDRSSPTYGTTIPHELFMVFQLMFAALPRPDHRGPCGTYQVFYDALVSRYLVRGGLLPVAHWIWVAVVGAMGALDFAGGTVVHVTAVWQRWLPALCWENGKANPTLQCHLITFPHCKEQGSSGFGLVPGFNAGSSLGANAQAVGAFVATHIAASTATVLWMLIEWAHRGKPLARTPRGTIAGLATITLSQGLSPCSAFIVGACAAVSLLYLRGLGEERFCGYDDALDVVGFTVSAERPLYPRGCLIQRRWAPRGRWTVLRRWIHLMGVES